MEKLDIHNSQKTFDYYYNRLENSSMSLKQVKQIKRFILEAQMGKNSKKKVGSHRLIANLQSFFKLHDYFKKDFDALTEADVEKFYQDLDSDRIKQKSGKKYKSSSKDELIRNLKRFTKWIMPEKQYNKKVQWLKSYEEVTEVPAISLKELDKLTKAMKHLRDKTLTLFLGDSGCRIEEALNLKISDIEKKTKADKSDFYIVNIRVSKTLPRRISIPLVSKLLTKWLKEHPAITDKNSYLFPTTYNYYRKLLREASQQSLSKVVTPHILRHSSATHYCKLINNPYKFCYRYGWTIGSKMARRYIDRNLLGEEAQEELDNMIKGDKVEELEQRLKELEKAFNKMEEFAEVSTNQVSLLTKNKQNLIPRKFP